MNTTQITYSGIELKCTYKYIPGESPNYNVESPTCGPGSPDDVEIYEIYLTDSSTNIYDLFLFDQLESIAELILDKI